jgi:hypothetical protein
MKFKIVSFLILFCINSSCYQHNTTDKGSIEPVYIKNAFENRKPINIDDISEDNRYIILESTKESLIDDYSTFYSDDQYLVSICRKQILLFDRDSGKFIRKIGNSGRGPNEYSIAYTSMPYNAQLKVIYVKKDRARSEYGLDGQLNNTKRGPDQVWDFINLDENTYASFIDNYNGDEKKKIVIFNKEDSILKVFPNYQAFPFKGSFFVFSPDSWFYKLNNQTYFCEKFNDTLFSLTSNSLTPRFVFDKGEFSFPYELRGDYINFENKYFLTENIMESSRFLFYAFSSNKKIYTTIYNKKQKKTIVNDYVGDWGNGYINNTNGFVPLEISSINDKDELICTLDAYKIKLWFETNAEKSEKLPEDLQRLKNIKETENPVVMIARLKK